MTIKQEKILADFKSKILSTTFDAGTISEVEGNIEIKTSYAIGKINFYPLDVLICEMSVTNLSDGENKFYLHFELCDLTQAEENLKDFFASLKHKNSEKTLKVLFTCTGGLTTGFFAETLNAASKILSRKFQFEAQPSSKIDEIGGNYDMIMLAPQIAYQLKNISNQFPNTLVLKIPPKIFASYDANELIKFFNWYVKYGI